MPEGDTERSELQRRLASAPPRSIAFWWRDDDAVSATPELDAMLDLRAHHAVPLALAVIPKHADETLVARLRDEPRVSVFQHGWQHINHADKAPGERASEFGESRSIEASLADLRQGSARLQAMFGAQFVPVFTPPWNRIGSEAAARRIEAGLIGLSAFGASDPQAHRIDGHVDVIDWKRGRVFVGRQRAFRKVIDAIGAQHDGDAVGLLTHHLVHDQAVTDFLGELLSLFAESPAVHWPDHKTLFRL